MVNNETEVSAESDMDCASADGEEEITVFFMFMKTADQSQAPLKSNFDNYTITGQEYDLKTVKLNDFEVESNTNTTLLARFGKPIGEFRDANYQWLNVEIEKMNNLLPTTQIQRIVQI